MKELQCKLEYEMQNFKTAYETMTPVQVYNDWYVIAFYESYYEMMIYYIEEKQYQDIFEWLNTFKNPLCFLYGEWLSCDGALCLLWDDMVAWLQDLKNEMEEF